MTSSASVLVVGTGQAAFQLAASLRDEGHRGSVTLLGEEPEWPYQRPPLSKAYLGGKTDVTGVSLRAPAFYAERDIRVLHERRAIRIDRDAHVVEDAHGERFAYDHLVLATGARNRPLPVPGAEFDDVLHLRTLADADALRDRLAGLREVVVIGAGFIGLEFAAVAGARGIAVTVIEATARPMSRVLSGPMSGFFREAHEGAGVRFEFGAVVARIDGAGGRATEVVTMDGRRFPADLVLAAVGVVPNVELAAAAGLAVANGITVDETLCTSDPAISAIGDCAFFPCSHVGGAMLRLESVQNAVDQARCVAARLAGRSKSFRAVPWFWSDQGPWKLQIAGLLPDEAEASVRGDPLSGAFSVFSFRNERLHAVESVNKPSDHMIGRRLLAGEIPLHPAQAADASFDLKALLN